MPADLPQDREWTDPTVHVPYRVQVEDTDGTVRTYPAHFVTLTPDFVFALDPDSRAVRVESRALRSVRITVLDPPADYDALRAEHPNAYEPWDSYSPTILRYLHESRITLGNAVRSAGRPPEHLIAKAPTHGYDLEHLRGQEPEPAQPLSAIAELNRKHSTSHDYLVFIRNDQVRDSAEILVRHNVSSNYVYRIGSWGFAARLFGGTVEPLLRDSDVRVERDDERLAPHNSAPEDVRIPDEYFVGVRRSADPLTVAARNGVTPDSLFRETLHGFYATISEAVLLDLRRDPDVGFVEDNQAFMLNDWPNASNDR